MWKWFEQLLHCKSTPRWLFFRLQSQKSKPVLPKSYGGATTLQINAGSFGSITNKKIGQLFHFEEKDEWLFSEL